MKVTSMLLSTLGLILIIWFVAPIVTHGILNEGNVLGLFFGIIVMLYGYLYKYINRIIRNIWTLKFGKIILSVFWGMLFIVFTVVVVASVNICASSIPVDTDESTVIVLGCRVREDGPSLMLSERITAAYRYLTDNPDKICILSGGKGNDEPLSEAQCMFNCLVDMGIEPERLIVEDKSTSTYENLLFSSKIISEKGLCERITVITNDFHMCRAMLISKKLNLDAYRFPAPTNITFYPTYFVREICGLVYYFVFGLK